MWIKHNLTEHAYCLLSCRDYSTLNIFLYQATVSLHQGQGHRNEHMCNAKVYRHAKCERYGVNVIQDISIIVHVKTLSHLRRNCDL